MRNCSVVWVLPATGGEVKRVTAKSPSYLHGWSPDRSGCATRAAGQRADIYKISDEGGEEIGLTTTEGVDDGAEFTPDGQVASGSIRRAGGACRSGG